MQKVFYVFLKIVAVLLGTVSLYFFIAWCGARIPVNRAFQTLPNEAPGVDVYVRSNGVHTDILLPLVSATRDWRDVVPAQDLGNQSDELPYISFGWGDKGFYLETPTWADLKASTALVAAFGLGSTAMHVEAVAIPVVGESVRRVRISEAQLASLVAYIDTGFVYDAQQRIQKINTTANYNEHDAFYEAHGRYSMIHTCNEWTRKGLSTSGIRTAIFSPFDSGVLRQLP